MYNIYMYIHIYMIIYSYYYMYLTCTLHILRYMTYVGFSQKESLKQKFKCR